MLQQEWVKCFQHLCRAHPWFCNHTQSLTGIFINHSQHLIASATAQLVVNKINAPDMVRMFGSQADDRAVLVIQAFAFLVTLGKLQPLLTPDPLHFLVIDPPAFYTQKSRYLAITVPTIFLGKPNECQP